MQNTARDTLTVRNNPTQEALPMRRLGSFLPGEVVMKWWGGAVPVVFARLELGAVAGGVDLDRRAAALAATDAFGTWMVWPDRSAEPRRCDPTRSPMLAGWRPVRAR